jgi:lactate dehydrogenase-like 2-hydroxyacid dehydrogenase
MRIMRPKVVVQFPIAQEALDLLQKVATVEMMSADWLEHSDQSLTAAAQTADALIGSVKIDEVFLRKAPKLKIAAFFGVGYQDRFDIEACTKRKVYVTYTPGALSDAVADLTLGLILCCARRIPLADAYVRSHSWRSGKTLPLGTGLKGKTLGILGLGRIGFEVAQRAKAFGMNIIYNDVVRNTKGEAEDLVRYVGFEEVLKASDFLTIHIPLNPDNAKKIGKKELKLMRKTAYLINTARGGIVDEQALCNAIAKKQIAGAGLDVFTVEPLPHSSPLTRMPNVVLTPHAGSATEETRRKMALTNATDVIRVLEGEIPINIVPEQRGRFRQKWMQ